MPDNFYDCLVEITDQILMRKDPYNHHGEKVAGMSLKIAAKLEMDTADQELLRHAACLHDVGKIFLEDVLLNYPRRLTSGEYEQVKSHCQLGYNFLLSLQCHPDICHAVHCHHERCDGSGYPRGLKKDDIPLFSRVIGVADSWDAMTSSRAYRPAWTHEQALEEMNRHAGWFDPEVYTAFLDVLREARRDQN